MYHRKKQRQEVTGKITSSKKKQPQQVQTNAYFNEQNVLAGKKTIRDSEHDQFIHHIIPDQRPLTRNIDVRRFKMEVKKPHEPAVIGKKNRLYVSPTFDSSKVHYNNSPKPDFVKRKRDLLQKISPEKLPSERVSQQSETPQLHTQTPQPFEMNQVVVQQSDQQSEVSQKLNHQDLRELVDSNQAEQTPQQTPVQSNHGSMTSHGSSVLVCNHCINQQMHDQKQRERELEKQRERDYYKNQDQQYKDYKKLLQEKEQETLSNQKKELDQEIQKQNARRKKERLNRTKPEHLKIQQQLNEQQRQIENERSQRKAQYRSDLKKQVSEKKQRSAKKQYKSKQSDVQREFQFDNEYKKHLNEQRSQYKKDLNEQIQRKRQQLQKEQQQKQKQAEQQQQWLQKLEKQHQQQLISNRIKRTQEMQESMNNQMKQKQRQQSEQQKEVERMKETYQQISILNEEHQKQLTESKLQRQENMKQALENQIQYKQLSSKMRQNEDKHLGLQLIQREEEKFPCHQCERPYSRDVLYRTKNKLFK